MCISLFRLLCTLSYYIVLSFIIYIIFQFLLNDITLCYIILYDITLYYIVVYFIILHFITLYIYI